MKLNSFTYIQKEDKPHGKAIIVGMMNDGPTAHPFILKDETSATSLLGDNESTRAYNLLLNKGVPKEDIYLFRLNGTPGEVLIDRHDRPAFVMQTMSSNSESQKIKFVISEEGVVLLSNYIPEEINEKNKKNFKRTYLFEEYPYLSSLAEAINEDSAYGIHGIIAESIITGESKALFTEQEEKEFFFEGAYSEEDLVRIDDQTPFQSIEKQGSYLYEYWERFYQHILGDDFDGESSSVLENIAAEVIYFADFPVDRSVEFSMLAGRIAKSKTEEQGLLCTALFRTSEVPAKRELTTGEYMYDENTFYNEETDEVENWEPYKEINIFVNNLKTLYTEQAFEDDVVAEENLSMKYMQIVVGEERTPDGRTIPGASHFLYNLLTKELSSKTNKTLEGFTNIKNPLDRTRAEVLSQKGYIVLVESIRRGVVPTNVNNIYQSNSFINQFYYMKIMSYISYDVSSILDKYIGQSIQNYQNIELEEVLSEYLNQYVDTGFIQSYQIGEKKEPDLFGKANFELRIVLFGQIEEVKTNVQLEHTGWGVDLWGI